MAALTERDSATVAPPQPPRTVRSRSGGRVWWRVYLHHLLLLRNAAIAWIIVIAGVGAGLIATIEDEYGPDELAEIGRTLEGVPAFEALFGRTVALDTLEGFALWRWGGFAVLLAAVWGMLAAGKLLRRAEEAGHHEPLRAGVTSPRRLLASAVAALLTTHLALAAAVGLTHTAIGMDAATAWALGGALALLAATFAAVGALTAQIAATPRLTTGIVATVLGIAFAVRVLAASTATPDWMWWMSPFGWTGFLHEVDGARGSVFALFTAVVVALLATAFALAHRELHAGRVGQAESVVERSRPVRGQVGLAAHLSIGPVLGWGVAVSAFALMFGLLANDLATAVADLGTPLEVFERVGYEGIGTPAGIVALVMGFVVLALAVFAGAQAAAIREEEASWRIEHLLVRPLGRVRWLVTRTLAASAAIAVLGLVAGIAGWLGTALTGTAIGFGDALLSGVNLIPVGWLFLGLGVLMLGVLPRLTGPVVYAAVVGTFLLDFVGALLELPEQALDLSPFRHLASVPVTGIDAGPALVMLAVGLLAALVGIVTFRRRDLRGA